MKKYIFLTFFLMACMSGHNIMTLEQFSEYEVGMTQKELVKQAGKPYSVMYLSNDEKEYEYIERIKVSSRTFGTRHYYFLIKNDKVHSKRVKEDFQDKPLLEKNAYDLQSS